jgi:hypothetical protein
MAAANSVPQPTIVEPATTSVPTLLPQPPQQQQPAQRQRQQQWHRQPQDLLSEPSQPHRPTQSHPPAHPASSGAAAAAVAREQRLARAAEMKRKWELKRRQQPPGPGRGHCGGSTEKRQRVADPAHNQAQTGQHFTQQLVQQPLPAPARAQGQTTLTFGRIGSTTSNECESLWIYLPAAAAAPPPPCWRGILTMIVRGILSFSARARRIAAWPTRSRPTPRSRRRCRRAWRR